MTYPSLTLSLWPNRVMAHGTVRDRSETLRSPGWHSGPLGVVESDSTMAESHMADSQAKSKKKTKKDIVRAIAERLGTPQLRTKDLVEMTFDALIQTLAEQGRVELRNFGIFQVRHLPERRARNPRTGETVVAGAKNVVVFKPGKEMSARIQAEGDRFASRDAVTDSDESGETGGFIP